MNWTEEQKEVIETREKNILVSAAAGSGKTAVLTERILRLVTDTAHPVDIDKLVVVTFTRAAAGEMRERILKVLQKKSDEYMEEMINNPTEKVKKNYEYMQKQLSFIHNAKITTIDSFCMDVVRENVSALDLDPAFKIGEEGELTLLRADVMENLLEEFYEAGEEDFLDFVDIYSSSRSDAEVEEMIMTLYRFAMSYPYPEEWVLQCRKHYEQEEAFEQSEWYLALEDNLTAQLEMIREDIKECLRLTEDEDGPFAYASALLSDKVAVDAMLAATTYEERRKQILCYTPEALSRKKQPEADEKKKEQVKSVRDDYKKLLKGMAEKYFAKTKEEVEADREKVSKNVRVLTSLVLAFMKKYALAKKEKNIVDFSDLEHFALKILVNRDENGIATPSAIAQNMAQDMEEIMIDEYQDSNFVQEMILKAVSQKGGTKNNLFMVGDVKQSIYKFRMAKPELFLEKYHSFERAGDGPNRKIVLSKNFRSRKTILDVTNRVFEKIMTKSLGGIAYDKDSALYYGADYEGDDAPVELLIADTSGKETDEELEDDVDGKELEAEMTALRIRKLYDSKFPVRDKKTGELRPVRYADMAILLRSVGSYGETYERVLKSKGIPVCCPVKKGCFDAFEVRTILEFLSVIDNPRQDIALTAVLKNMFRLSEEEIAMIKIAGGKKSMYENVMEAGEKLEVFRSLLQKYRRQKTYLTIYDLINEILEDTGFEYFISAFPDGTKRLANIAMLKERASVYQQGSYSGLFNFIRYIQKNEEYQVAWESLNGGGEEDAVTILSIHKSKGLEYPVVIVGALGKRFNQEDSVKKVVLHQTYGIGMDYYDTKRNIKNATLIKRAIAARIVMENMAEELRVLYVAMTRAKEKLILVGNGKMEKKWAKYDRLAEYGKNQAFHMNQILGATSYLDLLLMSLVESPLHEGKKQEGYVIASVTASKLAQTIVKEKFEEKEGKKLLEHWNPDYVYDKTLREKIDFVLSYQYPYQQEVQMRAKVSVTDIKQKLMQMYDVEPEYTEEIGEEFEEELVPEFLKEKESTLKGTSRGNAYHRIFQLLDYDRDLSDDEKVAAYLDELKEKGKIQEEERNAVKNKDILHFLQSDLGKRMKAAWQRGSLKREQQFVMGVPAALMQEDYDGEEIVLVQGIIDAYFEENGEICLVDYKTDYVNEPEELRKRYKGQLLYYAYALERICGKRVKDKLIYSVKFGKSIAIRD